LVFTLVDASTATIALQYGQRHTPPAKASSTEIFLPHCVQCTVIAILAASQCSPIIPSAGRKTKDFRQQTSDVRLQASGLEQCFSSREYRLGSSIRTSQTAIRNGLANPLAIGPWSLGIRGVTPASRLACLLAFCLLPSFPDQLLKSY
jgi:hypothetical protein